MLLFFVGVWHNMGLDGDSCNVNLRVGVREKWRSRAAEVAMCTMNASGDT